MTKVGTTGVELHPGGSSDPSARKINGYGLVVSVVDGQDATFLHESDDLVPLDTPIIVFLDSVTVTESHSLVRSHQRLNCYPYT